MLKHGCDKVEQHPNEGPFSGARLAVPWVGTALTIMAAVALQALIILLPLVGPAGARTPHARANFVTFLAVLLASLSLSLLAWKAKLLRRRIDGSSYPVWSPLIALVNLLLLAALLTGLLKI